MSAAALSPLGRSAVKLAATRRLVFPCHWPTDTGACSCGHADCSSPGKHPRTTSGLNDATADVERVTRWWRWWPEANIGMRTGAGLVVLDLDGPQAAAQLADLERELGPLPATLTVSTRRGRHLYFKAPPSERVPCSAGKLAPTVDVRADGGYVLVPPSRHAEGTYRRHDEKAPSVLPARWLARLTGADRPPRPAAPPQTSSPGSDREPYVLAALDGEAQLVAQAPGGARNATLNEGAFNLGQLVGTGALDRGEAETVLIAAAATAGLGEREAERTIRSGLDAGERKPRQIPAPLAGADSRAAGSPPAGDERTPAGPAAQADGLVVVSAADVKPRPVEWLMPGRVPLGMLTLLAGDPDLGKSTLTCLLAAQVSRGDLGPAGGALIANAEDSPDATLVPRLIAAGADLQAVGFPQLRRYGMTEGLTLPDDVAKLAGWLDNHPARLLVIDPLGAHLPSTVNSWQDASVRRALAPLADLAGKYRCAVVIVAHLNKSGTRDALYRVGGSIGIPGAVRSMLLFARDPDDPDGEDGSRRVAVHAKCNVARKAPAVVYRIESVTLPAGVETSRLTFEGESDLRSADVLGGAGERRATLDEACDFLAATLADGRLPSAKIKRAADAEGISERTLQRARGALGVLADSEGRNTYWRLPDPCQPGGTGSPMEGVARVVSPVTTGDYDPSDPNPCQISVGGTGSSEGSAGEAELVARIVREFEAIELTDDCTSPLAHARYHQAHPHTGRTVCALCHTPATVLVRNGSRGHE